MASVSSLSSLARASGAVRGLLRGVGSSRVRVLFVFPSAAAASAFAVSVSGPSSWALVVSFVAARGCVVVCRLWPGVPLPPVPPAFVPPPGGWAPRLLAPLFSPAPLAPFWCSASVRPAPGAVPVPWRVVVGSSLAAGSVRWRLRPSSRAWSGFVAVCAFPSRSAAFWFARSWAFRSGAGSCVVRPLSSRGSLVWAVSVPCAPSRGAA